MKLYSGPLSLFTGKVRIALDEKGLECDIVSVPFSRAGYQPKHPDVLAINPKAQVPVLVAGPVELYDSTVILARPSVTREVLGLAAAMERISF